MISTIAVLLALAGAPQQADPAHAAPQAETHGAVAALAIVPASGLPPAPTLFSLVTVLFATTLLEPVVMAAGARNAKGR